MDGTHRQETGPGIEPASHWPTLCAIITRGRTGRTISRKRILNVPAPRSLYWAHNAYNIAANKAKGDAHEAAVIADMKKTHTDVTTQVTVKTKSGTRTRLDAIGKGPGGVVAIDEAKASATAPLTRNQTIAHPDIATDGAVVVGAGKPGFPGGTVIPPTTVRIVRP